MHRIDLTGGSNGGICNSMLVFTTVRNYELCRESTSLSLQLEALLGELYDWYGTIVTCTQFQIPSSPVEMQL